MSLIKRPFSPSRPLARSHRHIRYRLVALILLVAVFYQQHQFHVHRQSLAAKYAPTDFNSNTQQLHPRLLRPDDEDSQFQDELLADRADWKVLGHGWEGKAFAYNDSVIKTFSAQNSPFRNCAPGKLGSRWPTEIPASLHVGGLEGNEKTQVYGMPQKLSDGIDGVISVKTYFMDPESSEWYLVTPLIRGGNLNTLSRNYFKNGAKKSFRAVDALYRPAFNRLLESLEALHKIGYCHDDIKPANIFVENESRWMLGDLGNLRQVEHSYHSSRLWIDNGQLEDCRANDAVRALKSYMQFVRNAVSDRIEFEASLFETEEPISRLFWSTMIEAITASAAAIRHRSLVEYPEALRDSGANEGMRAAVRGRVGSSLFSHQRALRKATDAVLSTRIGENIARWWSMTWLFGVPVPNVCEV